MKNTILARRYAKALFSLGKQEGKGEEYSEKLSAIAELFHDEAAGVRDALANPLYPLDMRQQVMVKIAENVQADAMLSGFLTLVVDKNRAAILPGLAWLDLEAKARFGQPFLSATDAGRRQIL